MATSDLGGGSVCGTSSRRRAWVEDERTCVVARVRSFVPLGSAQVELESFPAFPVRRGRLRLQFQCRPMSVTLVDTRPDRNVGDFVVIGIWVSRLARRAQAVGRRRRPSVVSQTLERVECEVEENGRDLRGRAGLGHEGREAPSKDRTRSGRCRLRRRNHPVGTQPPLGSLPEEVKGQGTPIVVLLTVAQPASPVLGGP